MKKLSIICFLLALALTVHAQDSIVSIHFDCRQESPTLSLIEGDGSLYHYSDKTKSYKRIYYLFTDSPVVKIAPTSKLSTGYSMAFNTYDTNSKWFTNDTCCLGNDTIIGQRTLLNDTPVSFRWKERAHLLISTKDRKGKDNKHVVLLVVLPTPPEDVLITNIEKYIVVNKKNGIISGNLIIHRTGRIIIDSVYVEGKKAYTTFRKTHKEKDTPYYRKEGFANVEVYCPWDSISKQLDLTVFCTRFNSDGTMTHHQIDRSIDLFEKAPFPIFWWIFIAVALVLLVLIAITLLRRRTGNTTDSSQDRQLRRENRELKEENEKLRISIKKWETRASEAKEKSAYEYQKARQEYEAKLEALQYDYEVKLKQLMKENERLGRPTQAAIDEAKFIEKCHTLLSEIEKLRNKLKTNPNLVLDEELKTLERIIINEEQ